MVRKILKTINTKIRDINFTVRVSENEKKEIAKLAKKYTRGNIAEWIRMASLNWKPKNIDLKDDT
jgi:hypothetical protein